MMALVNLVSIAYLIISWMEGVSSTQSVVGIGWVLSTTWE